jgi:hypothetical protein
MSSPAAFRDPLKLAARVATVDVLRWRLRGAPGSVTEHDDMSAHCMTS